ncbi:hypothetical protein [Nostoc sp. UHCC 0870]|uniref:hypothetical protein n=1 Tax=Nostoc sp. UHCC 0870 TaxID=2914041 RepID=UPI001EDFAF29|nr:hypothetical protein [Nostoc sp. UHCC 0870]UKO98470.1 hypothetical protein L6494_01650 [Nostoc sp. UHCC 0870]
MNTIFVRKGFYCLSSLAAVAVIGTSVSVNAQTISPVEAATNTISPIQSNAELETEQQNFSFSSATILSSTSDDATVSQQFSSTITEDHIITPIPGTVATTSSILVSPESTQPATLPAANTVAQSDINVGRRTRGGSSYIGVAGNIGINGGESSLGDGNFAAISKIGISNSISIRPSAIFGDNTTILIPVTYDFTFKQADPFDEPLAIAPYIGVGAVIKTGDNSQTAVLVSGGVDVPINAQFTATAAVNAGFFDETDIGLLVGVGYNFSGF